MPQSSSTEIVAADNWKPRLLVIGGVIGLLSGVAAAYMLAQRAERDGAPPSLSPVEGVKLGLLVFGLLRQVSTLGD